MAYNGHSMFQSNGFTRTPSCMIGWKRWTDEQLNALIGQLSDNDDYPEYDGYDREGLAQRVTRELDERATDRKGGYYAWLLKNHGKGKTDMQYRTAIIGNSHYSIRDNEDGSYDAYASARPGWGYLGTFDGLQAATDAVRADYKAVNEN